MTHLRQVAACVADVGALERELTARLLRRHQPDIAGAPVVLLDGNLSAEALEVWQMHRCRQCCHSNPGDTAKMSWLKDAICVLPHLLLKAFAQSNA